jgi:hypothetical protein
MESFTGVERRHDNRGRDVLDGEAAEGLDEPDSLPVCNRVWLAGAGGLDVKLLRNLGGQR